MERNRETIKTQSTLRPISVTSKYKLEKVEQLNSLVHQLQQSKAKEQQGEEYHIKNIKPGMGDKILDLMKNRIKNNYDHLYNNYQGNKDKIIKHIQTVETNFAANNDASHKFDQIIKQKAKYDKIKTEIQQKQKTLQKLIEQRNQFKNQKQFEEQKQSGKIDIYDKIRNNQDKKIEIQHRWHILTEMLKQRKQINLSLQQRYIRLNQELTLKKDKTPKLSVQNNKKQLVIEKIESKLFEQQSIDIPQTLAEQLSHQMQMYENKHSYNNIIQHQAVLEEERFKQMKEQTAKEREKQRINKFNQEKQYKNQIQSLKSIFIIRNIEEEKIKKLCGVSDIKDIIGGNVNLDKQNLQNLSNQINVQITKIQKQNQILNCQIQNMLNLQEYKAVNDSDKNQLQRIKQLKLNQQKCLFRQIKVKQQRINEWNIIYEFINPFKQDLSNFVDQIENKYIRFAPQLQEKHGYNRPIKKFTKITFCEQEQSAQFNDPQ